MDEVKTHLSFLDYEIYLPDFTRYAWEYIYKYFPDRFLDDIEAQSFSWKLIGLQWEVFKSALLCGKEEFFALHECRLLLKDKTIEP